MRIKRINHVEQACACGSLLGQIGCAASADNQHVKLVGMALQLRGRVNSKAFRLSFDRARVTAGEQRHQLGILVVAASKLNSATKVSIAKNSDSNRHRCLLESTIERLAPKGAQALPPMPYHQLIRVV